MSVAMVAVTDVRPGMRLASRCGVAEVLAVEESGSWVAVTFSNGDGVARMGLPCGALLTLAGTELPDAPESPLPIPHPETHGIAPSALSVASGWVSRAITAALRAPWITW